MKRKFFTLGIFAAATFTILQGCSDYKEDIKVKTSEFLSAYFAGDYEKAVTFCTDSLGSEVTKILSGFESLDPSTREMVIKQVSSLTTQITSVEKSDNKDTIKVNYKVLRPHTTEGADKTLSFIKQEKEWKVARLGNNL